MSLARFFYTLMVSLIAPLAPLYLLWRSRKQPDYRRHWSERFGLGPYPRPAAPVIWVHAVSVGETRAAQPLIDALLAAWPQHHIVLSHMTPTGRETGEAIVHAHPGRVSQCYLPYDLPWAMRRLLRALRPQLGVVMETEVWPNLLAVARELKVPVALVNARLSAKSQTKGKRTPALMREAAHNFSLVLAQSAGDALRLAAAGAREVEVVGNLKFDYSPEPAQFAAGHAIRVQIVRPARPVWLFASTREGEEAQILAALLTQTKQSDPLYSARCAAAKQWGSDSIYLQIGAGEKQMESDPIYLFVPRHPQRFDEVAALLAGAGWVVLRRSGGEGWVDAAAQAAGPVLLLGDSMGEMAMYYALADVALMGGSLLPFGSHNVIEPAAIGTPLVLGPSVYNFAQAADDAIAAGAAVQVPDAAAAVAAMAQIAADPARRAAMSAAGLSFAAAHRGATARTLARLAPFISEPQTP